MLGYTLLFLLLAVIAGVLGLGFLAGTLALVAKVCLFVFLVLFVISLVNGRGADPYL